MYTCDVCGTATRTPQGLAGHQRFRHGAQSHQPTKRASDTNRAATIAALEQQVRELPEHVDSIEVLAIGIAAKLGVPGIDAIANKKRGTILELLAVPGPSAAGNAGWNA